MLRALFSRSTEQCILTLSANDVTQNFILKTGIRNKFSSQDCLARAPIIPLTECRRFMVDCLVAVGTPKNHAEEMADLLVEADYRGHYSHGMNRLAMYVNEVKSGLCDGKATPKIIKETPATAHVDGQNGLGAVVGNFCMNLAIKKAKSVGVGWVVAKGSNHYGIAGMYPLKAIKEGLIGFSCTNTSPLMVPTRAKNPALGTNPLSLGAPGVGDDSFVLDMATTAVALGKIEIQRRKGEPVPDGWAMNEEGKTEYDAAKALDAGRLYPLGGAEMNSGYKGSGLGMLVEVVSGILGGANYGPNIRQWNVPGHKVANLGQCFIAVDPECFAPGFKDRMSDMMCYIREMEPADAGRPVLVAGDPERAHMTAVDKAGGVTYVKDQISQCNKLAEELNIKPLVPEALTDNK